MTPYTWAEKFERFERISSIRETNGNFDSCISCKRLGTSRVHELHESKFPFVSRIECIRSKLSNFSAHVYGVNVTRLLGVAGRQFTLVVTVWQAIRHSEGVWDGQRLFRGDSPVTGAIRTSLVTGRDCLESYKGVRLGQRFTGWEENSSAAQRHKSVWGILGMFKDKSGC